MPNTWNGVLALAKNAKEMPIVPEMTPLTNGMSVNKASSNVVSQVRAAVDSSADLRRADELKRMIDNPTSCDGREWRNDEKNKLKQATADYQIIQSDKENIKKSLNEIGSLFDEKSQQSTTLDEGARNIKSKLNEIDNHLSEYDSKLELLNQVDTKTEEESTWAIQAQTQRSKLISKRADLVGSLAEIQSLQGNLNEAEKTITERLEKLLCGGGPRPQGPSGPQSADAIISEMAEIKDNVASLNDSINEIFAASSDLFSKLFESIKNISSKIASQFKSANDALDESTAILSNYPAPRMQMRM